MLPVKVGAALKILQVSPAVSAGGAENSARNLHYRFLKMGLQSSMFVGKNPEWESNVVEADNDRHRNMLFRGIDGLIKEYDGRSVVVPGMGRVLRACRAAAEPIRTLKTEMGIEDFKFPGTSELVKMSSQFDIIQCHNLHGEFFNLKVLPELCGKSVVILNVRDAWLMTGHCAMPLDCQRWVSGCGRCPDLARYPSIKRDATAYNWKRKAALLSRSSYHLTAPSRWMLDKAKNSILQYGAIGSKVIPNGYDERVFYPRKSAESKRKLGFDENDTIIMTAGYDICRNIWKDFSTLQQAVGLLANRTKSENIHFLVIGAERRCEKLGGIKVHFLPFISDQVVLSDYYRAADIYLHGALVESFGNTLLEAKACATAIVAPAVGGIVEHVRSLSWAGLPRHIQHYSLDESQGLLTGSGDCSAMANALEVLIEDRQLAEKLGQNGALDAVAHYTLDRQANTFVNWYREILSRPSADL